MGKLTTKGRSHLPTKDFAGKDRTYPDEDKGHAKAALARASEFASPAQRASIDAKVHRKYPSMGKPAGSVGRELEKRLAAGDKK
jgi:hypothetical protein